MMLNRSKAKAPNDSDTAKTVAKAYNKDPKKNKLTYILVKTPVSVKNNIEGKQFKI